MSAAHTNERSTHRWTAAAAAALLVWSARSEAAPSVAFYAGAEPPIEPLSWFDDVVLDPERVTAAELTALERAAVRPLATVIVGPDESAERGVARIRALESRGFVGFVIDVRARSAPALGRSWIKDLHQRRPAAPLYWRGPLGGVGDLAPALAGVVVDGVAARRADGSLGQGLDPAVLAAAEPLRGRLPVIAVDRVSAGEREQARQLARALADRGFVPWITVAGGLGVGIREPVPRRILALYDGRDQPYLPYADVHEHATLPLEYLGYAVDYHDVRQPLPGGNLAARYAGIVTWFTDEEMSQPERYVQWVLRQMDTGMRVAVLGHLGTAGGGALLARLGVAPLPKPVTAPVTILPSDWRAGFEAPPAPLARDLPAWRLEAGQPHIELRDAAGQIVTPVVIGPSGGVAADPYVLEHGIDDRRRSIIDPFAFFTEALALAPIPAPDPTTENGRRLMTVHIDGDGFASVAELPDRAFSGEVVMREFLERYPLPTTVSIIEGETSAEGTYPRLAPRLERIARDIFRLPNVELASHTFSHPFDWARAAGAPVSEDDEERHSADEINLPIAGYRYSVRREVEGSVRYINEKLAPPDKKVRVFLWSGTALPGEDALREVSQAALANMNGFDVEVPLDAPTLAQVPSLGRFVGPYLQVYAQAQNENVYTDEWRGPFYGFRRVIEMFRFTESPRRLKPIDIYYHFYSGTKAASITALHDIYRWALQQDTTPVFASELCAKVEDFQRATLARRLDGGWDIRGLSSLRTVRLDPRLGWPDLDASAGVVGIEEQGRYVSVAGASPVRLAIASHPPGGPFLSEANASVISWVGGHPR